MFGGQSLSLGRWKSSGVGGGDGHTIVWTCFLTLDCALKNGDGGQLLGVFCSNRKRMKTQDKARGSSGGLVEDRDRDRRAWTLVNVSEIAWK